MQRNTMFNGITILDLTQVFSGPYCTKQFAELGAKVIKIENPNNKDSARTYPPIVNDQSGYFQLLNHTKQLLELDLKQTADLDKFYTMVKSADVVAENYSPKTKDKLKIDYKTLKQINPTLIYLSISGLSQSSNKKYYDVTVQAESGLASLSGTSRTPMKIGPAVVDAFAGAKAAYALASALYNKQKTGKGCWVQVSMMGCALDLLENNLINYEVQGKIPARQGNLDSAIAPFGFYKTKDSYIALAVGNKKQWIEFKELIKHNPSYNKDLFDTNVKRLKNSDLLTKIIHKEFSTKTSNEILKCLQKLKIPCSKINNMKDISTDKTLVKLGLVAKEQNKNFGEITVPLGGIKFTNLQ